MYSLTWFSFFLKGAILLALLLELYLQLQLLQLLELGYLFGGENVSISMC